MCLMALGIGFRKLAFSERERETEREGQRDRERERFWDACMYRSALDILVDEFGVISQIVLRDFSCG